ncbi:MAG TPA: ATP-binding cassette domain-containing protein [Rhodanobacteraceae bacterium]
MSIAEHLRRARTHRAQARSYDNDDMSAIECLRLHALTLPFGAAREISHAFRPGLHLVTGPNGIGKTSLLRAIAGALPPMSGTIQLGDAPLPRRSDRVVLAPSAPPALAWLRAGLLIDFVLSLYPASRRDQDYRRRVVQRLHLSDVMDVPMGSLSAGMAKKILLAATLIAAPTVLLFDEPTNEIDAASCEALVSLLAEYRSDHIMLVATHHLAPFRDMAASTLTLGSENGSI